MSARIDATTRASSPPAPRLRATTLMFHDVVADGGARRSGFQRPGALPYKLPPDEFERHLDALARAGYAPSPTVLDLRPATVRPVLLTFDDGGVSALAEIAPRLERRGWRGHFFIPTDFIGAPTFLQPAQIRELRARGHVVGSHSASHPPRFSALPRARMLDEWRRSVDVLAEVVGAPVRVASVPEGYYSTAVAETAAAAGIEVLFTSTPWQGARRVGDCVVVGRYTVCRGMASRDLAGLASGRLWPALAQSIPWGAKELVKRVAGEHYLVVRARLLERRQARSSR